MENNILADSRKVRLEAMYMIPQDTGMILQTQRASLRIGGATATLVVGQFFPLLDGTRNASEAVSALGNTISEDACVKTLEMLRQHQLLMFCDPAPASIPTKTVPYLESMRRFLASPDQSGWAPVSQLNNAHVVIVNTGAMTATLFADLAYMGVDAITLVGDPVITEFDVQKSTTLTSTDVGRAWDEVLGERYVAWRGITRVRAASMPTSPSEWEGCIRDATLVIAVITGPTYFYSWTNELNSAALATGVSWMLLGNVQGFGLTVGPTMVPYSTACFHCLEIRMKSNLRDLEALRRVEQYALNGIASVDYGTFAPANDIAAHLCSLEARDMILSNRMPQTVGNMLVLDMGNGMDNYGISSHAVLKLPRCPVCSSHDKKQNVRPWA